MKSKNKTNKTLNNQILIFYTAVRKSLCENRDIIEQEIFDELTRKGIKLTLSDVGNCLKLLYNLGALSRKENGDVVTYNFSILLDSNKKICFPDGSFLYLKNIESINEWRKIIYEGVRLKFPQEEQYYRPV